MAEKRIIIHEVKNSGLVNADPSPENYQAVIGGIPHEVAGILSPIPEAPTIFPNGIGWKQVWLDYGMPEIQFNLQFDTYCCVIYSIAKSICLYIYKVYGIKITISEMYNAFYAGVIQNRGTTIEKGMESFRKNGWVSDSDYPFTQEMTAKEFFVKPPKTIEVKAKGVLTKWNFHWEVLPRNLQAIFETYKKMPVVLTGFAWASYYGTGVYYDYNNAANHAFLGLEPKGINNLISDTYPKDFEYQDKSELDSDELLKELHKTFNYGSAHRCWVTPAEGTNIIIKIINMLKGIVWFHPDKGGDASVWMTKETSDKGKMKMRISVPDESKNMWEAIFATLDRNFGIEKVGKEYLDMFEDVSRF